MSLGSLSLVDGSNGGLASNYSMSSGTLTVNKRQIKLTGARKNKRGSTKVLSKELKMLNLVEGETLVLSGNGTIPSTRHSIRQRIKKHTLLLSDKLGEASNYSIDDEKHEFVIEFSRKDHVKERMDAFRKRGKRLFVKAPAPPAPAMSVAVAPTAPSAPAASSPGQSSTSSGGTSPTGSSSGSSSDSSSASTGGASDSGDTAGSGQEEPQGDDI